MRLANVVHGMFALGWLAAMAAPALANPSSLAATSVGLANSAINFDLARDCPRRPSDPPARGAADVGPRVEIAASPQWPALMTDQFDPHITYQPLDGGPTFALAALGAGRKGRPGLAHVALGWSF